MIRRRLLDYLNNDFSGSNVFAGFSRSMFQHHISVKDEESELLAYALNELATMVVAGQRSYFTLEGALVMSKVLNRVQKEKPLPHKSVAENIIQVFTGKPAVWEAAESASLLDTARSNPRLANDMMVLKGGQLAKLIFDILGARDSGHFLAALLNKADSSEINLAQIKGVANEQFEQLGTVFDTWFGSAGEKQALPGIKVDQVMVYKLPETINGRPAFQYKLTLSNAESAPGYLRIAWLAEGESKRSYSEPALLPAGSAAEYGLVLSAPPSEVYIEPYYSLNRREYRVAKVSLSALPETGNEAFEGLRSLAGPPKQFISHCGR